MCNAKNATCRKTSIPDKSWHLFKGSKWTVTVPFRRFQWHVQISTNFMQIHQTEKLFSQMCPTYTHRDLWRWQWVLCAGYLHFRLLQPRRGLCRSKADCRSCQLFQYGWISSLEQTKGENVKTSFHLATIWKPANMGLQAIPLKHSKRLPPVTASLENANSFPFPCFSKFPRYRSREAVAR